MISLLAVLKDGKAIETATVGREGVVRAMAGLGLHAALARAVVQVPIVGSRIAAAPFRKAVQQSDELRDLIVKYNQVLFAQVQTTAACNALHPIEARLSRWILQTRDRTDTDRVPLTQEFLSEMLGVRRTSVSEVAHKLQDGGLIRYRRLGMIEIRDRPGLEQRTVRVLFRHPGKVGAHIAKRPGIVAAAPKRAPSRLPVQTFSGLSRVPGRRPLQAGYN